MSINKYCLLTITFFLVTSCSPQRVDIKGDIPEKIEVVHSIDLGEFEDAFKKDCEEQFPNNQVLIDECVQVKIDELINLLTGNSAATS